MFTVSRALSGADGVSEGSREQVLKAVRELEYIPNRAAQELRRASRDTVAVITASTSNSYYLDLMAGIQQALRPSNWTVVVGDVAVDGAYDPRLEDRMIQRLIESRAAGVISTLTLSPENTKLLANWDIPVVFVDSSPPATARDFPSVTTDNYSASLTVGQHLAEHGFKDWLFLVYPPKWSTRFDRERGIRDSAKTHRARIVVLESENDAASAHATLAKHLDVSGPLPDVLIAGNNPLLLGALNLVRERNIGVPADMALVGYDEFAWASLVDPPLTVLNERSEEIGQRAAQTLTRIIDGQAEAEKRGRSKAPVYLPEYQQQVPAELVIRKSCGCGWSSNTHRKEASS
jgi:LacI family transcriptional regulator